MDPSAPATDTTARRPWQFRLRTLLFAVALVSIVLAVLTRLTAAWGWGLLLGASLVAAHVFANAWGTRQRQAPSASDPERPASLADRPLAFAPNSHLIDSTRVGWLSIVVTVAGAIICGSLGSWALARAYAATDGYAGVVVGGISAGVLGGFVGFLCSTFYDHSRRALRDATQFAPQIKRTRR